MIMTENKPTNSTEHGPFFQKKLFLKDKKIPCFLHYFLFHVSSFNTHHKFFVRFLFVISQTES